MKDGIPGTHVICPQCDQVLLVEDASQPLPDHMDPAAPMQACVGSGRVGVLAPAPEPGQRPASQCAEG